MKRLVAVVGVLAVAATPLLVWGQEDDEGAKVEQFKIKLSQIKQSVQRMSQSGEALTDLKDEIAQAAGDPATQTRFVGTYLEKRLESIKLGREVIAALSEAIASGQGLEMLPDRPDVAEVLNTYVEDFKGVIEDMRLLEVEGEELFKDAEGAEGNPVLAVSGEMTRILGELMKDFNQKALFGGEGKIDTERFFEDLKKLRYAVKLHWNKSLVDYKLHSMYFKAASLKGKYADMLNTVFKGMDLGPYLLEGVMDAQEMQGEAALLGNMLDSIKLPSLELLTSSEKREKFLKDLSERPKNYKVGDTWHYYHRKRDRYYYFEKGRAGQIWAPMDYAKGSGRYVRRSAADGKWYSHDPSYPEPVEVFPDEEM